MTTKPETSKLSLSEFLLERYEINKKRGYPQFYLMIDLHGTIIPHSRSGEAERLQFISEICMLTLQRLCSIPNVALIAWSSTSIEKWKDELEPWFAKFGIKFKYFNENPDCSNGEYSVFDDKFYYDAGIDDKFNFDPNHDWIEVLMFATYLVKNQKLR